MIKSVYVWKSKACNTCRGRQRRFRAPMKAHLLSCQPPVHRNSKFKKLLKPPKTLTASQDNWYSWMHKNPQKVFKTLTGSLDVISITCRPHSKSQKHSKSSQAFNTLTASRDYWWIWVQKICMDSLKWKLSLLSKFGLTTPPDWRPFKIPVSPKITSRTSAGYLPPPSVNSKAKHTCQICDQFTKTHRDFGNVRSSPYNCEDDVASLSNGTWRICQDRAFLT